MCTPSYIYKSKTLMEWFDKILNLDLNPVPSINFSTLLKSSNSNCSIIDKNKGEKNNIFLRSFASCFAELTPLSVKDIFSRDAMLFQMCVQDANQIPIILQKFYLIRYEWKKDS